MARLCWVCAELLSALLLSTPLPAQTTSSPSDQPRFHIKSHGPFADVRRVLPPRVLPQVELNAYLDEVNLAITGPWQQPSLQFAIDANLARGASLSVDGRMSLPAVLLRQMRSEAELAALLAHLQVHRGGEENPAEPHCILVRSPRPSSRSSAEAENNANRRALATLKAAGYEPEALLDLLSRVSYENPDWSVTLRSEDLLSLRLAIEQEEPPRSGSRVDSSAFDAFQHQLADALGEREPTGPSLSTFLPMTSRRVY